MMMGRKKPNNAEMVGGRIPETIEKVLVGEYINQPPVNGRQHRVDVPLSPLSGTFPLVQKRYVHRELYRVDGTHVSLISSDGSTTILTAVKLARIETAKSGTVLKKQTTPRKMKPMTTLELRSLGSIVTFFQICGPSKDQSSGYNHLDTPARLTKSLEGGAKDNSAPPNSFSLPL
jgi:hypothetical protein